MAGLFDLLGSSDPATQQGLLSAYASLLQSGGPSFRPTSLGSNLGGAVQAYQQGVQGYQDRELQKQLQSLRLKGLQGELDDQERARKKATALDQAARDSFQTPGMQALALGGGPTVENAARIGDMKGGFDTEGYINRVLSIDPKQGVQLAQLLKKAGTEFDTKPQTGVDANGQAFQYLVGKDGTVKRLDGVLPRDELHWLDTGGKQLGVNKFTGAVGASLTNSVSPNTAANNAVAIRGQNLTNDRAREFNQIARGDKLKAADQAKAGQVASFDTMLDSLDRLSTHPGLSRSVGLYSRAPTLPGSDSANFQAELQTFKAQSFIPMVAQLKGMGALSDAEGKKLSEAVGALDPKMSETAFRDSIKRIKEGMEAARLRVAGKPRDLNPSGGGSDIDDLIKKYGG